MINVTMDITALTLILKLVFDINLVNYFFTTLKIFYTIIVISI